ncbi:MAG: DUF6159 family protein [Thermoplasmatota archaeon]
MNLGNSLRTSWQLTKASWRVLMQDKELLWMPFLSFLASLMAVLSVVGLNLAITPELLVYGIWSPVNTALALLLYVALAFVAVYFHAATVAGAHERLAGGDPTVGSALRAANRAWQRLLVWAIIVATINLILQVIREKGGALGRMVASIGGTAWNLATFFVVPSLLFTDDGVGASLTRSGRIFKERWGEAITGHVGLGLATGIIFVAWAMLGINLIGPLGIFGIAGLVFGLLTYIGGMLAIALIGTVLSAIYKAALYRYAQGEPTPDFSGFDLALAAR